MISLKEAIKLTKISDDEVCYIRKKDDSKYDAIAITGEQIRNKYDMKHTQVITIRPKFYVAGDFVGMEFIIDAS